MQDIDSLAKPAQNRRFTPVFFEAVVESLKPLKASAAG
jgi:hypothetical protein